MTTDLHPSTAPAVGVTPDGHASGSSSTWFLRRNLLQRHRLSGPGLRAALDRVEQARADLDRLTAQAGDALYALIGEAADPEARRELVAARRALSRGKAPRPMRPVPPAVAAWMGAREELASLEQAVHAAHAEELAAERGRLATMLADPALSLSLPLLTADVAQQASRYVAALRRGDEITGRLAKSERGLLQYAMRAATRTSPLARLTSVGLTSVQSGAPAPEDVRVVDPGATLSLDRVMLDYVMAGALERAGLADPDPCLMVPPTGRADAGRLYFLTPTTDGYARSAVTLTGVLKAAVERLSMGPVTRSALAAQVAASLGSDRDEVDAVLARALDMGMLTTTLRTDALPEMDLSARGEAELDAHLERLRTALAGLAAASPAERAEAHRAVEEACAGLSRFARRPARIAVNEDHVLDLSPVDPAAWGPALDDLGAAVGLLHVFDWLADVAISLERAHVRLHGAGSRVPLTEAAPALVAAVTEDAVAMSALYADPASDLDALMGPDGDATLVELYRVRRSIEAEVHRRIDEARREGAAEVTLDPADVRAWVSHLPARLRDRALTYGVLVQRAGERVVVNDGLPGHGMLHSRFLGADQRRGGGAVERLARRAADLLTLPGHRLLEDRGTQNLNVNVHPPVLPDRLEPQDWEHLELVHDPAARALRVEDAEGPVQVLPMGGGHPGLYPPALSVASGLVIAGRLYNGLPDTHRQQHPAEDDATVSLPRVSVGDAIVCRRRWYPGADFWDALAQQDDADRLLALDRWRRRHDVPEEVFVKTPPVEEGPASVSAPQDQGRRFRAKPQYVDLTSALAVRVLPRMMARKSDEAMPDSYIEEAAPTMTQGDHAEEWVIEADRPAGGEFTIGADHD